MQSVTLATGETILFDRKEQHDDKVLFFRHPIGLVRAANITEIESIQDVSDNAT